MKWDPIFNFEPEPRAVREFVGECPAGYTAVSAGWELTGEGAYRFVVTENRPLGESGWRIRVENVSSSVSSVGANLFLHCQHGLVVGDD